MDRQQFWKLLEPIHPQAESFCRRLAGNRDDGDDLYQTAVLRAIRKIKSLKEISAFKGWLFRIIINCNKNRVKQPLWRKYIKDFASSKSLDPRAQYDAKIWLERTLNLLSVEERALVTLYEIERWKISELSEIFKKPEGTIKARLSRARKKMRTVLEEELNRKPNTDEITFIDKGLAKR